MATLQSCRQCLALSPVSLVTACRTNAMTTLTVTPIVHNQILSRSMFYQRDKRGPGYSKAERLGRELTEMERLKESWERARGGLKLLPGEWEKFKKEAKIHLEGNKVIDMVYDYPDGCFQKEFIFRGHESLDRWVVSTDRDWGEGFTKAELTLSKNNMALFQGHLCTDLPKDGNVKRAGYANLKSLDKKKSFGRDDRFQWANFTHFIARVRGDGRTYVISLHTPGWCDMLWNDTYHFFLFTRGGPYWQDVKIPFSRFFFGSKGSIQDRQLPIDKTLVNSVGFSVMDTYDGPFQLEIDYIGVFHEKTHNPTFEYEQYKTDLAEF